MTSGAFLILQIAVAAHLVCEIDRHRHCGGGQADIAGNQLPVKIVGRREQIADRARIHAYHDDLSGLFEMNGVGGAVVVKGHVSGSQHNLVTVMRERGLARQ